PDEGLRGGIPQWDALTRGLYQVLLPDAQGESGDSEGVTWVLGGDELCDAVSHGKHEVVIVDLHELSRLDDELPQRLERGFGRFELDLLLSREHQPLGLDHSAHILRKGLLLVVSVSRCGVRLLSGYTFGSHF